MKKRIIFMGTPEMSADYLDLLIENDFKVIAVYTQPPKRSGRGMKITNSPVHDLALNNNIPINYPKDFNSEIDKKKFKKLNPDLVVIMAYGLLLPKEILNFPKFGCINIHVSLLPRWRGAAPIEHSIINGDKKTGITIFKLEETLDTGPIIAKKEINIPNHISKGDLTNKLNIIGKELLKESLPKLLEKKITLINQDHQLSTYANKIHTKDRKINFNNSVTKTYNFIRAFSPLPGAWFNYNNEKIKIIKCDMEKCDTSPSIIINKDFHLGCLNGKIIPRIIQRQGKKQMVIEDFLRGFKFKINQKLNV